MEFRDIAIGIFVGAIVWGLLSIGLVKYLDWDSSVVVKKEIGTVVSGNYTAGSSNDDYDISTQIITDEIIILVPGEVPIYMEKPIFVGISNGDDQYVCYADDDCYIWREN